MGDENSAGFSTDDGGTWADANGGGAANSSGDPTMDFEGLTWKEIEAAVLGGGALTPGQDQVDQAYSNVNWQSLNNAATIFDNTQRTVAMVAESIRNQTAALAGTDGPWQGTAADNFRAMMETFASKFDGLANQISDGRGGGRNIPTQLANSGAYLKWAQDTLRYIDHFYAQQVIAHGQQMDDGRAPISQFPEAVDMMTKDMKNVATQLATQYNGFSIASYNATPPAPPSPENQLPENQLPETQLPETPVPQPLMPTTQIPPPSVPPPPDTPPPGVGEPPPDITSPPDLTTGGPPPGGGGELPPPVSPEIPPPPRDVGGMSDMPGGDGGQPMFASTHPPEPPGFGGADGSGGDQPPPLTPPTIPPPPGGFGGSGGNGGAPPPLESATIPSPPGEVGGGSIPPLTPPTIPPPPGGFGGSGNNGREPGAGGAPPPLESATIPPPPIGEQGSGGLGSGGAGSPQLPPPPGGLGDGMSGDAFRPSEIQPPPSVPGQDDDRQGGGGMPMMPPPGGMGGGGAGGSGAERPDSSGLLGDVQEPWLPTAPDALGPNEFGETPPLESASWAPPPGDTGSTGGPGGLDDDRQGGGGMPMMPPPGGMGGGGAGGSGAERPDSSGLLGDVQEPWLPTAPDALGPNEFGETPPLESASWAPPPGDTGSTGGPGDTGGVGSVGDIEGLGASAVPDPPAVERGPGNEAPNQQSLPQGPPQQSMPMMPPPGGMGGPGAGGSAAERPDSSGLLGDVREPWLPEAPGGVGDPVSVGVTSPSDSASWATPPGGAGDGVGSVGGAEPPEPPAVDVAEAGPGNEQPPQQQLPQQMAAGGMPMMPPPGGTGGAGTPAAERPDSSGLLGGVDSPWATGEAGGMGDPRPSGATPASTTAGWASRPPAKETGESADESTEEEDVTRIAVVRPSDTEDTSAWDVGTADLLPGLLPGLLAPRGDRDRAELDPDRVERTDEPWRTGDEPPRWSTYHRLRAGEGESVSGDAMMTCADAPPGGAVQAEPDVAGDGEDDEEETEQRMADLLRQDGTAWGAPVTTPSGVLE